MVSNMNELFSISYMGCHPNPIYELHHFSRWLLHHQPDVLTINTIKNNYLPWLTIKSSH